MNVLIVDDHAIVRQELREVLESYADMHIVGEAVDGQEAVRLADHLQPSIVVMDINMPKMNGIEATREITARHPNMIVIGLSVNVRKETQEAMERAGATTLLRKEEASDQLYNAMCAAVKQQETNGSRQWR